MAENKPEADETQSNNKTVEKESTDSSLGQIRNILFGSQMDEYQKKLSHLEEKILNEISQLKDESNNRFDLLESFFKKEIELLSDKLKTDKDTSDESLNKLILGLKNTANALEKKIE